MHKLTEHKNKCVTIYSIKRKKVTKKQGYLEIVCILIIFIARFQVLDYTLAVSQKDISSLYSTIKKRYLRLYILSISCINHTSYVFYTQYFNIRAYFFHIAEKKCLILLHIC